MNAEWNYVGEGGKHALFASDRFRGKLLRIDKENLRLASCYRSLPIDNVDLQRIPFSLQYFEMCISPRLSPYVDTPEIVALDWNFLEHLRLATIANRAVPLARVNDWFPSTENLSIAKGVHPTGMLVVDYRGIPPSIVQHDTLCDRRLLLELKPKAGYLSLSPLVDPCHRAKLMSSRFSLHQILHQRGHIKKGWAKSADGIRMSDYEPLDLFSQDKRRMTRAIKSLIFSPQNNLRIWYNNQAVTKGGELLLTDMEVVLKEMMLITADKLEHEKIVESAFASLVSDLVVSILYNETLLEKLLTLQQLDFLDADGAVLISERLVELCNGSILEAEYHISQSRCQNRSETVHPLLSNSPFRLSLLSKESAILQLCKLTEDFRKVIADSEQALLSSDLLTDFHNQACAYVRELSTEECAYLLSNWLLSLAMCDVSILITLEQFATETLSDVAIESGIVREGNEGTGIVRYRTQDGSSHLFAFMVRLIDLDPKPPTKLWGRKAKEAVFAKL